MNVYQGHLTAINVQLRIMTAINVQLRIMTAINVQLSLSNDPRTKLSQFRRKTLQNVQDIYKVSVDKIHQTTR